MTVQKIRQAAKIPRDAHAPSPGNLLKHESAQMKTILVTGGAKRLGLALTSSFLEQGFFVISHHHTTPFDFKNLSGGASRYRDNLMTFSYNLGEVTDLNTATEFFRRGTPENREIDILINNASRFEYDKPGSLNPETLRSAFSVNLQAPLLLMEAFLSNGKPNDKTVVNMLDSRVISPNMDYLSYSLSKSALGAATKIYALAFEGIAKIYGVAPSMFLESGPLTTGRVSELSSINLTQEPVNIGDVISAVNFCVSGSLQSGFIIPVDGGQSMMNLKRDVAYLQEGSKK